MRAVGDLRGSPEIALALRLLGFVAELLDLGLELSRICSMTSFSRCHWARIPLALSSSSAIWRFTSSRRALLAASRSFFSACSSIWSCIRRRADRVDLRRHAVDFHLDLGGGLVDEIDRLVGQEPIGHVPIAQRRGRDERRVLDADAVVDLVALLEPAQDRDRVLDRRLRDEHRLEAPLERGVLLDPLPVLVERRRADAAQLAARERGLEQVRRVHRALGRAGADDGVQLVDEEDDLPCRASTSLSTAFRRSSNSPRNFAPATSAPMSSAHEALVLQRLGHVAAHDALRDALDDGRLADARLADEHGVVLRAPREHLHDAADLLVAPDDRVDLALARRLGEIAAVLLERLELPLGVLVGDALAAPHAGERGQELLVAEPPFCSKSPAISRSCWAIASR